jgi:high frequency lysogenization protein
MVILMSNNDKVLALAGLVQAVKLVKQLATKGYAQETELKVCLLSILQLNVQSTEEVYGGDIKSLRFGLFELKTILDFKDKRKDSDVVRYMLSIMHLEKQVRRNNTMLAKIQEGINTVSTQLNATEITQTPIISSLATIYQQTLSTCKFKIQVTGNPLYLTNMENINKIRALLLAAIRSAVLWNQLGGSKWNLIFNKKDLLAATNDLLAKHS